MHNLGSFALMGLVAMATHQAPLPEAPSSSRGESASISEVWSREDQLGRYEEAGDLEAYRSLYHDKFIGWSCSWAHPKRKVDVGRWVEEVRDQHIKETSEVTREGAEDFGNIVVVHYRFSGVYTYPDGHTEKDVVRITHTWMRSGETWQIIGGMCASLPDNPK